MASKKNDTSKDDKKGYEPKATARHAKMTQSKKDEIETLKQRIDTDKYLAKKYETNRKTEIKSLPKEDRAAAKAELKESITKRKESESKDKEKLRTLTREERAEKGAVEKAPFDEDAWVSGGKKKTKKGEAEAKAETKPEAKTEAVAEEAPEPAEAAPEAAEAPKKKK